MCDVQYPGFLNEECEGSHSNMLLARRTKIIRFLCWNICTEELVNLECSAKLRIGSVLLQICFGIERERERSGTLKRGKGNFLACC